MTTEVSICNQAISWLGGNRIISLDDETTEARLCKANYAHLRDVVLELKAWTFAVKRVKFAKLAEAPIYGFSAAFAIPTEILTVLQVSRFNAPGEGGIASTTSPGPSRESTRNGEEQRIIWQREGEEIVCDENAIVGRCIQRIIDPTKFSPGFVQTLAARIAREIALPLTHSNTLEDKMVKKYDDALSDGAVTDGLQGRSNKVRSDALTRVR